MAANHSAGAPVSLEWLTPDRLLELVAHDINNLCHGALSYIDLAAGAGQPPEVRARFLETAKQLTYRASRFAPHLGQLNELRSAQVSSVRSEPLSMALRAARDKASELNFLAPLDVEKAGNAWDHVASGGKFVTQALAALLDNAIRYQRPGTPAKAWAEAWEAGDMIRITVRDNGRGFPKGAEVHAARRFSQSGSVSGAGLGLAFVRILAERTGGSLEVGNSPEAPGESGAVVTLRLPVVPER